MGTGMKEEKISVIIPTKNSERTIDKCLSSVYDQDYELFEVIVVDGGSKDDTLDIAKAHGAMVLSERPHEGNAPGIGRNYGAKKAKGNVLAFLDSDCYPEKTWLTKVSKVLSERNVGIYAGVGMDKNGNTVSRAFHYLIMQKPFDFAPSRCMAIRKKLFWQVNGFDETLTAGEDNDLSYRIEELGYDILVDKELKVCHDDDNVKSFRGIWKKQMWYVEAERGLRRKWPQRFKRFKTSVPLREHMIPVVKAIRVGGVGFTIACLLIKFLSVRKHL